MQGVRQTAKQATRQRVLTAARDLFDDIGYEDATIRMIAQRAGVSVGSVFTTFAGKSEILSQVMEERLEALYGELDRILPHLRGPTVDRLRSIMAAHYGFETRRHRLFVAYIAASYGWSAEQAERGVVPLGRNAHLKGMLAEILRSGVQRGDVRPGADVDAFIDTLLAAYVWNYRLSAHERVDAARMIEMMDRQIGLIFEGVAAR